MQIMSACTCYSDNTSKSNQKGPKVSSRFFDNVKFKTWLYMGRVVILLGFLGVAGSFFVLYLKTLSDFCSLCGDFSFIYFLCLGLKNFGMPNESSWGLIFNILEQKKKPV